MVTGKILIYANDLDEKLRNMIRRICSGGSREVADGACMALSLLREAVPVDAVEVVHGRWLYDSGSGRYFCSACGEYALSFKKDTIYDGDLYEVCLTDYCPNCGAKMDGGNEDV